VTPSTARDSALEQAARVLSLANLRGLSRIARDEAEDVTACLVTVANEVR
jgi:hypothetical protein